MSLRLVSNDTGISRCGGILRQRFPLLQQRHSERLAMQAVDDNCIGKMIMGITVTQNEYITLRHAKEVGNNPPYANWFDRSKEFLTVEHFNIIAVIPVAGYDDLPTIQFHSRCQRSLLIQTAKARE